MIDLNISNTTDKPLLLTGEELINGKLQDGLYAGELKISENFRIGLIKLDIGELDMHLADYVESVGVNGKMLDVRYEVDYRGGNTNAMNVSGILGYSPFDGVVFLKDFRLKIKPYESIHLNIQSIKEVLPNLESSVDFDIKKLKSLPIRLIVKNERNFDGDAVMFGFNHYKLDTNFGSSVPIVIKTHTPDMRYREVLSDSAFYPFKLGLIRIVVNGNMDEFLKNDIVFVYREPTGRAISRPLYLKEIDYATRNRNEINTLQFGFIAKINARTHFKLSVPAGVEAEFSFFPNLD